MGKIIQVTLLAVLVTQSISAISVNADSSPTPCEIASIGVGRCEFTDGIIAGYYAYDEIVVPDDVTLVTGGPVILEGALLIEIAGSIIASNPRHLITLRSSLLVDIDGAVTAMNGQTSSDFGGSVHIEVPLGTFALGGIVTSGNGADGDDAAGIGHVIAAPGGQGGDILISATYGSIAGILAVGNGGNGGNGHSIGVDETYAGIAESGRGGESGLLTVPATHDIIALYAGDHIRGGRGGDGGAAVAEETQDAEPPIPALFGQTWLTPAYDTGPDGCYVHDANDANTDYYNPPALGGSGSPSPSNYYAKGNDGGWGLIAGGNGQDAIARGSKGCTGGRGGMGWWYAPTARDAREFPCGHWTAATGGDGGAGSNGRAEAGRGGDGTLFGGNGGSATAYTGDGGDGGPGGAGAAGIRRERVCGPYAPPNWIYRGDSYAYEWDAVTAELYLAAWFCDAPAPGGRGGGPGNYLLAMRGEAGVGLFPGTAGTKSEFRGTQGFAGQYGSNNAHCGAPPSARPT